MRTETNKIDAYTAQKNAFKLGHKQMISKLFNSNCCDKNVLDNCLKDIPYILGVEQFLLEYKQKMQAYNNYSAPTLTI